ncbi:MAG: thiamine-phosphate pyrophosphorylase [Clostridia bacterium]|nr:thiamine-phosphate pyrophosphorylase [Clostridia bacterium]
MEQWDLYVIITTKSGKGRSTIELVRQSLIGGATAIQLREKEMLARDLVNIGQKIREMTLKAGAKFIVNDRLDVALAVEADGLHIGQDDLPAKIARKLLGPDKILGVSVGTVAEAKQAVADGADYIGVGIIYNTNSKDNVGNPIGLKGLNDIRKAVSIPIVAIGGINHTNAREVITAGADGVSVISAVLGSDDIASAASQLLDQVKSAKAGL